VCVTATSRRSNGSDSSHRGCWLLEQRAFERRSEEQIRGIVYGEILGQEMIYNDFDTELVERIMQLGT